MVLLEPDQYINSLIKPSEWFTLSDLQSSFHIDEAAVRTSQRHDDDTLLMCGEDSNSIYRSCRGNNLKYTTVTGTQRNPPPKKRKKHKMLLS